MAALDRDQSNPENMSINIISKMKFSKVVFPESVWFLKKKSQWTLFYMVVMDLFTV